jgi:hypothetical protein
MEDNEKDRDGMPVKEREGSKERILWRSVIAVGASTSLASEALTSIYCFLVTYSIQRNEQNGIFVLLEVVPWGSNGPPNFQGPRVVRGGGSLIVGLCALLRGPTLSWRKRSV